MTIGTRNSPGPGDTLWVRYKHKGYTDIRDSSVPSIANTYNNHWLFEAIQTSQSPGIFKTLMTLHYWVRRIELWRQWWSDENMVIGLLSEIDYYWSGILFLKTRICFLDTQYNVTSSLPVFLVPTDGGDAYQFFFYFCMKKVPTT